MREVQLSSNARWMSQATVQVTRCLQAVFSQRFRGWLRVMLLLRRLHLSLSHIPKPHLKTIAAANKPAYFSQPAMKQDAQQQELDELSHDSIDAVPSGLIIHTVFAARCLPRTSKLDR